GTTLEDEVAGLIKLRLEPENLAKDVGYSNDVIISNAAMLEKPIKDARTRNTLALEIRARVRAYMDEFGEFPRVILLANHGLIALGQTPRMRST
ncbi:MAG: hypothetical protein HC929_25245, partial [Leptolyngbyaceae cyanobacterium SM2_5_2]|nr:hypothetical protein [Leptolyngbyaceae cyanobacterium SM2_5_2]